MQVGLVDRAWARISGLVDDEGASAPTLILTAQLFFAKDWPKRAREVLNRGLTKYPDDRDLQALWARLTEPQTTPDLDALDNDAADAASLITAAHHLIAAGSHTRARALLDRAQKIGGPSQRIDDMIWALEGDFSVEASLQELVERHGPSLSGFADLDDEPEHTESISAADLPPDEREKHRSFPNLFRDQEPRTEMLPEPQTFDEMSDEVTKISTMMDIGVLDTLSDGTFTAEHTEIQRVITRKALFEDSESETAFDLSSLQSDLTSPESEDDDVVVMTRKELDTITDAQPQASRSDLVLDDASPVPAPGRQQTDEAETWVLPKKEEPDTKPQAVLTEDSEPDLPISARPVASNAASWSLIAVGGVVVLTLGALVLFFAYQIVNG